MKGLNKVVNSNYNFKVINEENNEMVIVYAYHLSCKSDFPDTWKNSNLAGLIIYNDIDETEYHDIIQPGFIYIRKIENLNKGIPIDLEQEGMIHGKLFYQLFREQPSAMRKL